MPRTTARQRRTPSTALAGSTVLVTGGAGFIGSAVVRRLIGRTPQRVVNLDALTYAGSLESVAEVSGSPRYRFEHVDVCDAAEVRRVFREHAPAAVVHLAAETHVDRSIRDPSPFVRTNVVGTATLLEEACRYWRGLSAERRERFRLVQVSTDEVFGSADYGAPFTEDAPYRPSSPYAASKAAADHFAGVWQHTYGLPVVVTYGSNSYGPFQYPEKLVPVAILAALDGLPIPLYGTGTNVREWTFVDDHADALIAVLERGRPGGRYAIGSGCACTNLELVRTLCRLVEEMLPERAGGACEELIRFVEDRPGHDARYAVDAWTARRELGWAPQETLEVGLRRTIDWYLRNRPWCDRVLARREAA